MKKIITLCIFCAIVGKTHAQLLKKIKDKVNNAATNATKSSGSNTSNQNENKPTSSNNSNNGKLLSQTIVGFNSTTPYPTPITWGPYKDAAGNRYGIYDLYRKYNALDIYKTTPQGETFLYYSNEANKGLMKKDVLPVMDAANNIYFINTTQRFTSISRLTNTGKVEFVAGGQNTKWEITDGTGANGKMEEIQKMKILKDGNIYFTEIYNSEKTKLTEYTGKINNAAINVTNSIVILRKLTPEGELTTPKDKNGDVFVLHKNWDFDMDAAGNIYTGGQYIYKITPNEGLVKIAGTPDPYEKLGETAGGAKLRWVMGDVSKAKIPGIDKIFVNSKDEIIVFSGTAKRFAKIKGKTVTLLAGTNDMKCWNQNICGGVDCDKEIDGAITTATISGLANDMVQDGDDIYFTTYDLNTLRYINKVLSVRKISTTGTVKTIQTYTTVAANK